MWVFSYSSNEEDEITREIEKASTWNLLSWSCLIRTGLKLGFKQGVDAIAASLLSSSSMGGIDH